MSKQLEMSKHFPNMGALYVFALRFFDTNLRAEAIGLTMDLYKDEAKAEVWKESITQAILSSGVDQKMIDLALAKLKEVHEVMVFWSPNWTTKRRLNGS